MQDLSEHYNLIFTKGLPPTKELISSWVILQLEDGSEINAYYHQLIGWLIKGDTCQHTCQECHQPHTYKYGYIPLTAKYKSRPLQWRYR